MSDKPPFPDDPNPTFIKDNIPQVTKLPIGQMFEKKELVQVIYSNKSGNAPLILSIYTHSTTDRVQQDLNKILKWLAENQPEILQSVLEDAGYSVASVSKRSENPTGH